MLYLILHFTCLGSSAPQVSKQTLIFILKGRIRIKQLQKYPIIVIPARLQHVQRLNICPIGMYERKSVFKTVHSRPLFVFSVINSHYKLSMAGFEP